jgi:hypothetical protein
MVTTNVVKGMVLSVVVVGLLAITDSSVFAQRRCYTPVLVVAQPVVAQPVVVKPAAVRQVRVTFFDAAYSLWIETDALVGASVAEVGVSAIVDVPGVGKVQAWIVEVYARPKLSAPK